MKQFKPQKGKAFDKLPKKALATFDTDKFLLSTKYDGNQIFIVKEEDEVTMYTSDWKQFCILGVAEDLKAKTKGSYVLIAEFMHNSLGQLGDRRNSAILTTYRTSFAKGLVNYAGDERFSNIQVFDYIDIDEGDLDLDMLYERRLSAARLVLHSTTYTKVIETQLVTGAEAKEIAKGLVNNGWEGAMLSSPYEPYLPGKRVNYSIKLKYRKTVDLECIDTVPGEGKYEGLIGALVLRDKRGRRVSVGSGLSDADRTNLPLRFIGSVVEIEYEQIMATYIQPTFLQIRDDKLISEID